MRIVEESELRAAVTPERAVAVMREAFRADGDGRTLVPAVINLMLPYGHGEFHIKTAWIEGNPYVAVKVATGFPRNTSRGLPSGSGLMAVFDASTGLPSAILVDNGFLTDIRTAAAGALAADLLGRRTIDTVGVLGSGVQARWQIRCLATVRKFRRLLAWSPTRDRLDAYCREMQNEGFSATAAATPEAVCRAAEILITATPARAPLVFPDALHEGLHVTALGSDAPGKQELDPACFDKADLIVVDRYAQCAAFGELKHALDAGLLTRPDIHGELGEVAAGKRPGRTNDRDVTIADLTGVGFQDTAIASAALTWITS